jgi:hypothetical protein
MRKLKMTNSDAGDIAGSNTRALKSEDVTPKPPISPAARKLAEYIARRMAPMIEHAGKQGTTSNHTNERNK